MRRIGIIGAIAAAGTLAAAPSAAPVTPAVARRPRANKPAANLSRNHPDYGLSPAEHEQRKRERAEVVQS